MPSLVFWQGKDDASALATDWNDRRTRAQPPTCGAIVLCSDGRIVQLQHITLPCDENYRATSPSHRALSVEFSDWLHSRR
jgi:hypothetical protein